jgi:hypothetical protein
MLGYTFAERPLKPRLHMEYVFASGDEQRGDGRISTFDQLLASNHRHRGIADQVGLRNIRDLRSGVHLRPVRPLLIRLDHHSFWLSSRFDAFYTAGGGVSVPAVPGGARSTYVGDELDLQVGYEFSPHVTLGGGFGRLVPGAFLKETTDGATRMMSYLMLELEM